MMTVQPMAGCDGGVSVVDVCFAPDASASVASVAGVSTACKLALPTSTTTTTTTSTVTTTAAAVTPRAATTANAPAAPGDARRSRSQRGGYFIGPFEATDFARRAAALLAARGLRRDARPPPSAAAAAGGAGDALLFFSSAQPGVPLRAYVLRLLAHARCSPEAFVVMLLLVDRALRAGAPRPSPPAAIGGGGGGGGGGVRTGVRDADAKGEAAGGGELCSWLAIHRVVATALMVAAKLTDDRTGRPSFYARVAGLPSASELIPLERAFLRLLDHNLFVSLPQYNAMIAQLASIPGPL